MKVNEDVAGTSSHLPVLRWAHETVGGSILEFGGGLYSTPYLVSVAEEEGVDTVTIEESEAWRVWLKENHPGHRVVEADPGGEWGVVLIDHGEGEWAWIDARAAALESVRGRCGIALVHDWHIGPGHRDDVVGAYRYHAWFAPDDGTMHTAIASNMIDVSRATIPGGRVYSGWDDAPTEWPN